jgi:hypothetical protein
MSVSGRVILLSWCDVSLVFEWSGNPVRGHVVQVCGCSVSGVIPECERVEKLLFIPLA